MWVEVASHYVISTNVVENVGDNVNIPLPQWVLGTEIPNSDIFYTNQTGNGNKEYLTVGVDKRPLSLMDELLLM